ncbi:VanZ family protein [Clostridium sp. DL1XJH146]
MNKDNRLNIILSWMAVILWMVLIFKLSSQVADTSNGLSKGITAKVIAIIESVVSNVHLDMDTFNHIVRKNAHFFAYFILGILAINAMRSIGKVLWSDVVITILFCVFYAMSDEIHQFYVPGRGPQIKDVFIDSMGALCGIIIYLLLKRKKNHIKKPLVNISDLQ